MSTKMLIFRGSDEPEKAHAPMMLGTGAQAMDMDLTLTEYPASVFIMRIPAPALLPRDFDVRSFQKGVDEIIVMSCGHECPYEGAYDRLATRISRTHKDMKERGMDPKRLRICAICTVCSRPLLKEVGQMHEYLTKSKEAAATGQAHD